MTEAAESAKARKLRLQRQRRAGRVRLDYCASDEALRVLAREVKPDESTSAVLNRLITEWAKLRKPA